MTDRTQVDDKDYYGRAWHNPPRHRHRHAFRAPFLESNNILYAASKFRQDPRHPAHLDPRFLVLQINGII